MSTDNTISETGSVGYVIGFGFLALALVFLLLSPNLKLPSTEPVLVEDSKILPGAFRVALSDPPMINIGTLNQRCSDCHALFTNERDPERALTQHTHVNLMHGDNASCLNCHSKNDREKLALRNGGLVGFDHVEQLCAQCHGPIYNDWERGTHGKTVGYWDLTQGEATKLSCTQCHDPHQPTYQVMEPLPGPNTLRMGDPHGGHDMIDENNPLQRWRLLKQSAEDGHGHDDEGTHP